MNVSCPDCRSIFRVDPAKVPPTGVRARCSVCSGIIPIPAPTGQNTPPSGSTVTAAQLSATPVATQRSIPPGPPQRANPQMTPQSTATGAPAASRPRPELVERATAGTVTPPSSAASLPEFTAPPISPPFRPSASSPSPAPSPQAFPSAQPFQPPAPSPFVPAPARPATPPRPAATPSSTPTPTGSDSGARRPLNPFLSKDPNQRAKRLARALVSDIITYHPAKHAEGLRDGTLKQLFREEIKKSFEEYIAQVGQQLAEGTTYFQEALNEVLGAGKKIF